MARDPEQTSPADLQQLDPEKEARQLLNPPVESVSSMASFPALLLIVNILLRILAT